MISIGVGLLFLVALLFLVNKLSTGSIEVLNANRYAAVIEKTPVSKDTTLMVVQIGDEGIVLLQGANHTEVLKKLDSGELCKVAEKKKSTLFSSKDVPIIELKAVHSKLGAYVDAKKSK